MPPVKNRKAVLEALIVIDVLVVKLLLILVKITDSVDLLCDGGGFAAVELGPANGIPASRDGLEPSFVASGKAVFEAISILDVLVVELLLILTKNADSVNLLCDHDGLLLALLGNRLCPVEA